MLFRLPATRPYFILAFGLFCGLLQAQTTLVPHVTRAGGSFFTEFQVSAPATSAGDFVLQPYTAQGTLLEPVTGTVAAGETRLFSRAELLPEACSHFTIESGELNWQIRYGVAGGEVGTSLLATNSQSNGWQLQPGDWTRCFDAFAVVNRGDKATDVFIRHMDAQGQIIESKAPTVLSDVPPMAKRLFVLNGSFETREGSWFRIVANEPLAITFLRIETGTDQPEIRADAPIDSRHDEVLYGITDLPPSDKQTLTEFRAALDRFEDLDPNSFNNMYAPNKSYRHQLGYDPQKAQYMDLILNKYPINGEQLLTYISKGFVINDNIRFNSMIQGFKEIYQRHLPVYVSADSILDALHLSFDRMLLDLENAVLIPRLELMLDKLAAGLADLGRPEDGDIQAELDDLAFWIDTARSLLAGQQIKGTRNVEARVEEFLDHLDNGVLGLTVELFGQDRKIDFSQFNPRGHYTRSVELSRYFQAMTWIQRIGMNFSRDAYQARTAWLLARNLEESGARQDWQVIEDVLQVLLGDSDSLNGPGMMELADLASIESATDLLGAEGFDRLVAKARETGAGKQLINSMLLQGDISQGFTPIPPAFFLLGQRFILDSYVFTNVVHDRVKDRSLPDPLDTWFVLGNRNVLPLLRDQISDYNYQSNLAAMDWLVSEYDEGFWQDNLYNSWLDALRKLSADSSGDGFPPAMQTEAWDRRMLQAQLGSWAHLRHDTLLYAKASYSVITCEYPTGWVDPYPDFYAALGRFAARARALFEPLGIFEIEQNASDVEEGETFFSGFRLRHWLIGFEETMSGLEGLAQAQLDNRDHSQEELHFLNNMVSFGCAESDLGGWYVNLVYQFNEGNAEAFDPTIADIHTDGGDGKILHVGVGHPNLMLLSIHNECGTTAYVGPVFSYHQLIESERLTDALWQERLQTSGTETRPFWVSDFVK